MSVSYIPSRLLNVETAGMCLYGRMLPGWAGASLAPGHAGLGMVKRAGALGFLVSKLSFWFRTQWLRGSGVSCDGLGAVKRSRHPGGACCCRLEAGHLLQVQPLD